MNNRENKNENQAAETKTDIVSQAKPSRQVRRAMERELRKAESTHQKKKQQYDIAVKEAIAATEDLCWEDLMVLYNHSYSLISQCVNLDSLINEVMPYIEDKDYLESIMNRTADDVTQMVQELKMIYDRHASKTGHVDIEDVLDNDNGYFNLATAYNIWVERFESVVIPNVNAIFDIHYAAKVAEAKAKGTPLEEVTRVPKIADFNH